MNKKKQNKIIVVCALFIGIFFIPILLQEFQSQNSQHSFPISLSDVNNHDLLMDAMDGKLSQYNDNGFFSTYYTPSLQGVFYALSSYNTLGNLDLINQTEILNYILNQYDIPSEYFLDPYAVRYLDTDFDEYYLPLNTLLEVNCFAVLALEILGELNQINTQTMVDFIWSCYHPTEGGFIGQPYNAGLHNNFRIPTLDNTYFAVKALDVLIDDWNPYTLQKAEIIQFIGECQSMTQSDGFYGGFENDLDPSFDSLDTLDPNLVSSYYALKTLDILNALETVDLDAFHEYLSDMYHPAEHYFDLTWAEIAPSFGIPAATSLGLDLSVLTGFEGVAELEIFNYLNSIQNSIGLWPTSLEYSQFELIDTFQVLRSLNESGYIHYFTPTEKDEIADGLNHFKSYEAYSTTPVDLVSISRIFSVARSFKLFDRETDLAIHELYSDIKDAYFDPFGKNYRGFYAYTNTGGNYFPFRIYPIEYFNVGNYSSLEYTEHLRNHKTVLHALLALQSLYKLDDFENYYDLSDILNSTLDAQIIEPVSEHFGAFLPTNALKTYYQERQDKYVFLTQSYYAVRLLEFLSDYLGLAPIEDLIVDVDALNMFVFDTFESPGEYCYSMPRDTDNVNIILKNTYFASYIMTALDSFTQNTEKIKNYLLDHIDYTNLENIYYCWKLDQLLELDIPFQVETVQTLINSLYTEIYYDFCLSTDSPQIKSESLYWICDMANHDEFRYEISHADTVQLDSNVIITVEIDNLILDGIGDYGSLKFESEQLGVYSFTEVSEGVFKANVFVPLASENYPMIYGNVCRYGYSIKQDQVPVSFETEYDFYSETNFIENPTSVDINLICSIHTAVGSNPLSEGSAYAETYYEGNYIGIELFSI
ncbi:MAG: hypothetical protein GF311_28070, partial [Candidatus Lokiarchaeota archaeon]|nr:hypothetical protein [Candidatus Lokiarchaeota archaeon]